MYNNGASDQNLQAANKGGIYPPSANEIHAAMLPRTKSKDSISQLQNKLQNRYGAGA